jgi:NAD(P)-dependent dehydrogenase (short-subunit alcohol dehydrogenase family)
VANTGKTQPHVADIGWRPRHTYAVGDVIYSPPGPDVAVYYRTGGPTIPDAGVVPLARLDSSVRAFNKPGSVRARLERIKSTQSTRGGEAVNPTYDFNGQVALVTGASSGMGLATAHAFAEAGASVVLADINEEALHSATQSLAAGGFRALGVVCDVTDEDQVAALLDRTVAAYGRLDMAFNNAGIMISPSDAAEEPADNFDRVNAINLRGVWACMKYELRQMREQGGGAIVNCSSLGGLVGLPGRASYHASKHGVLGLTKSAALEYAPRGIRINAVCPGTIDTPMVADMLTKGELDMAEALRNQPIGRLGTADEIAAAVLWLCSPAASFVIGVALPVDGGYTAA